jgi:predicted NAD/FAD-binding protein
MKIAIAGAGIGGLTAALCLYEKGLCNLSAWESMLGLTALACCMAWDWVTHSTR